MRCTRMDEISETKYLDNLFREIFSELENNGFDTTEVLTRYEHGLIDTLALYQSLDTIINKQNENAEVKK